MNKQERIIVIVLRVIGTSGLCALPVVFFPFAWMNAIHEYLGMGELPDRPIVHYLTRSLSFFYAVIGTYSWLISRDIRRYRAFAILWGAAFLTLGFVILGIDLHAGMPWSWTWGEGPPSLLIGICMLWLQRHIQPWKPSAQVEPDCE